MPSNLPTLEQARVMAFAELRKAIDDAFDSSGGSLPDVGSLIDLLEAKIDRAPSNIGAPPVPPIEPAWWRADQQGNPADELRALDAEISQLTLGMRPEGLGLSKEQAARRLALKLSDLRQGRALLANASRDRAERSGPWLAAKRRYQEELAVYERRRSDLLGALQVQINAVERLRRRLQRLRFAGRVPWRLLPPGWWNDPQLAAALERRARSAGERLDLARISWLAKELGDPPAYTGLDEFAGYVAFCPDGLPFAVLDKAVVGNAIYVLKGDWRALSQLPKAELLEQQHEHVERVVHSGAWQARFRAVLREARLAAGGAPRVAGPKSSGLRTGR